MSYTSIAPEYMCLVRKYSALHKSYSHRDLLTNKKLEFGQNPQKHSHLKRTCHSALCMCHPKGVDQERVEKLPCFVNTEKSVYVRFRYFCFFRRGGIFVVANVCAETLKIEAKQH